MAKHNELGVKGEQLAVDFLLKNNYVIIERNYDNKTCFSNLTTR